MDFYFSHDRIRLIAYITRPSILHKKNLHDFFFFRKLPRQILKRFTGSSRENASRGLIEWTAFDRKSDIHIITRNCIRVIHVVDTDFHSEITIETKWFFFFFLNCRG